MNHLHPKQSAPVSGGALLFFVDSIVAERE